MKKFISLLLSVVTALCFVGCKKKDRTESKTGRHSLNATDTSFDMVKDGKSDYKVLIPVETTTASVYAQEELTRFFEEATGITLEIVQSKEVTHTADGKYISLGNTEAFKTSGLAVDEDELGRDGVRIITKDKTVYIAGGSDYGVLYGVYDFLKINFGFEFYYKDCYDLDTGVKDLKLKNFDVTDIPDIPLRVRNGILFPSTSDKDDTLFAYRMRTADQIENMIFPIHMKFGDQSSASLNNHNSLYYLPRDEYEISDPEFYSIKGEQLCYTARGNQEKFERMTTLCAEKAIQSLKWYAPEQYPLMNTVMLGIADNWDTCNCESCKKVMAAHNDSEAAAILIFINAMGKKVVDWMNLPENAVYKRDDLQFTFFAYQSTLTPPFKVDDNGNVNAADDLKSPQGVKVQPFNAFSTLDYGKKMDHSTNVSPLKQVEDWAKYTSGGWSWSYGGFFHDYLCFYDLYSFYGDFYKFLFENKYQLAFAQLHTNQRGAESGFFSLANYVICKLGWDTSLETEDLINDYIDAMYKEAAPAMKEIFTECRLWFARETGKNNWTSSSIQLSPTVYSQYFDIGFVNGIFKKFDKAYESIKIYEKDKATYATLKSHIDMEWLFPAKVAISSYRDSYRSEDMARIMKNFKDICGSLRISRTGEESSLSVDAFLSTF